MSGDEADAEVWRAPMRPRDSELLAADAALAAGVVGIGDTDERRVGRLAELAEGAFLWTRAADGGCFLGRVGPPPRRLRAAAGLSHTRPAEWLDDPFAEDEVPGAVLATFARGGRNLQRIRDPSVGPATVACWERRGGGSSA